MSRRKITRLAFAIVILSFVLSTFVSLWSLHLMAQRNVQELSKSLASRIYDSISSELSEPIIVARSMARDYFLIDALKKEGADGTKKTEEVLEKYLSSIKDAFGCEAAFVVSDASMYYYSYGGISKKMNIGSGVRDRWYVRFISSGKDYDVDVDRDEVSGDQWTVFVDARIEDESGMLLGACGVGARMTGSQDLLVSLEKEYGVRIDLIDSDGLIQVDTDENRIQNDHLKDVRVSNSSDYIYQKLDGGRFAITKYVENLDWYLVIESDGNSERKQLINLLLLNIVLCAGVLVIMLLAIRIIIARTRALSNASFVDQSTQLLNRRAFEEKKAELSMTQLEEDFVYITADLNGLKKANDTLGHAAGDELIKGAADCMKACFGKYGDIYRIGGDEFAAMLYMSGSQLDKAMDAFEEAMASWKGRLVDSLSVSCGHATSREFPSENIAELGRISDERMYAAKEAYYQKTGTRR